MSTDSENIQALARAVHEEVEAQAAQTIAAAQAAAARIGQEAAAQAVEARQQILQEAQNQADGIRKQAVAAARLKARMLRLGRREALLQRVFAAARERLPEVQRRQDYAEIARALVLEGAAHVGGESAEVRADRETQKALTSAVLAALAEQAGMQLSLGEPLAEGIGVVVQTPGGQRRYDNTLEARLRRSQDELRAGVYHVLTGEPT